MARTDSSSSSSDSAAPATRRVAAKKTAPATVTSSSTPPATPVVSTTKRPAAKRPTGPTPPAAPAPVVITELDLLTDVTPAQTVVIVTETGSTHELIVTLKVAPAPAIDGRTTITGVAHKSDNKGANSAGKESVWTVDRMVTVGEVLHYNRAYGVTSPVKSITVK